MRKDIREGCLAAGPFPAVVFFRWSGIVHTDRIQREQVFQSSIYLFQLSTSLLYRMLHLLSTTMRCSFHGFQINLQFVLWPSNCIFENSLAFR